MKRWLLFFVLTVSLQAECKDTECAKNAFEASDQKLNEVYQTLKKNLKPVLFKELKQSSLEWIRHKEYICEFQLEMRSSDKTRDQEYYECLDDYTTQRTKFIQQAFREHIKLIQPGEYADGMGGSLTLTKKANHYVVKLEVVRGPTFHTGEVSGTLEINGKKGIFKPEDSGMNCKLTFDLKPGVISITENDCSDYHGVRAYFDGTYRKID